MKKQADNGHSPRESGRIRPNEWKGQRWTGIERTYSAEDVRRLQGTVLIEHTLARRGAERLWDLLNKEPYVHALGALTGNQAVQQVRA